MKVFTCSDHDGVWLGGASVIVAEDETQAAQMLKTELASRKLKTNDFTLEELNPNHSQVKVLWDGDY